MNSDRNARRATATPTPPLAAAPAARPVTPDSACSVATEIDSQHLLQGHNTLLIHHQGEVYRLQQTRLGKLILTK